MPTRLILREAEAPPQLNSPRSPSNSNFGIVSGTPQQDHQYYDKTPLRRGDGGGLGASSRNVTDVEAQGQHKVLSPTLRRAPSTRKIVRFRSSIIRDIPEENDQYPYSETRKDAGTPANGGSMRNIVGGDARGAATVATSTVGGGAGTINSSNSRGWSAADIRGSTRLMGYFIQLLASSVMLMSVIQFYLRNQNNAEDFWKHVTNARFYTHTNGIVYYWKLIGSILVGVTGAVLSLVVLLAHFDTVCLPRLWHAMFLDGSIYEKYYLGFLVLFWSVALHICTSSLSVGELQPNVFFTTWIAFFASVINCGVWRISAGLPSIAEQITLHDRETQYNWSWTLFSVCVYSGSVTDVYLSRNDLVLRVKGEVLNLSRLNWVRILSINWALAAICIIALLINQYTKSSFGGFIVKGCDGKNKCLFGWRQIEGLLALAMAGYTFWIIFAFTGPDSVINGLKNSYFGVWGAFYNSIFTFGTWMRENKNFEFFLQDDDKDGDSGSGSAGKVLTSRQRRNSNNFLKEQSKSR